tara:strand:- start:272 stop:454 length:183 start_codon:yes stop_codon:yes gene_type:complete
MQLGQSEEITRYLSCAGMDCLISWIHGSLKVWNASTARNKETFARYQAGIADKPVEDHKY